MSPRALMPLVVAAGLTSALAAEGPPQTVLKGGRVLDVIGGRHLDGQALLIEGERIKDVGPAASVQAKAAGEARVIDLGGATLLPGLIDCNAHLFVMKGGTVVRTE